VLTTYHYKRPKLYDYQLQIIDADARFTVTSASTKVGKTASHVVWLHEQALQGKEGYNYWWVAPVYNQAKIAFSRLKIQLGESRELYKFNNSNLTIDCPSGAIMHFKSGEKPDNLYGEDVYAVVIDEFTRMREESWFAIRSTLTKTKGRCKFIGNARGKGWGYKLGEKAKHDVTGTWNYFKITAYDAVDVGLLDIAEIEDAKRTLPIEVFNELYLAIPSDSGVNPFGVKFIQQCVKPLSNKPASCYGIDLAKSFDYTVIVGLDEDCNVCHFDRFQLDWAQTKKKINSLPKGIPKNIDATGVGDPIVEDLQNTNNNVHGFKYNQQSKQVLMLGIQTAIQLNEIGIIEGIMQDELESFEFEYTITGVKYNAPSGMHDDCVNALALAKNIWSKQGTGKYNII
jgi:Terminase large subunit, T4likevirus-type, N-terminal/Terminase RNaseH-like domain